MSYTELKKIYYGDSEAYAAEYIKRFHSEECVKLNFKIGENQAFFLENTEVMRLAYKIARLDKKIDQLCGILPGEALNQYSKKCLIDEIVITNKIEGVHSSRSDIGETLDILELQSESKGKYNSFAGIVSNYLKLIKADEIVLSECEDIRKLYDEVFLKGVVMEDSTNRPDGKMFRKGPVSVYSETDKVIHNGLMPESRIIEAMDQALRFLKDKTVEELFRICIFHYLFEYIHPFYDGNGRMGRLIFSYGLSENLTPLIAFRISGTIKKNINLYYKAFKACNDQHNLGDLTPFLLMQLGMIYAAMEELRESLEEKCMIWDKYENYIGSHYSENQELRRLYSYLIQAALFSEKGIMMSELEENMKLSEYKVKNVMKKIPDEMIVIRKKGNYKCYSLNMEKLNTIMLRETFTEG